MSAFGRYFFLPALRAVFIGYRLFLGVLRIDWSCSRLGCYRGVLLVVLPVFSGVLLRVFFATSPPAQKPLGKGFAYLLAWVKSLFFLLILLYFCIRIFTHKQIKRLCKIYGYTTRILSPLPTRCLR